MFGQEMTPKEKKLEKWWREKQEFDKLERWKSKHKEVVIATDEPDEVV